MSDRLAGSMSTIRCSAIRDIVMASRSRTTAGLACPLRIARAPPRSQARAALEERTA